jgi:hypothetical protein
MSAWDKDDVGAAHLVLVGGYDLVALRWILAGRTGVVQVYRVPMFPAVCTGMSIRGGDG